MGARGSGVGCPRARPIIWCPEQSGLPYSTRHPRVGPMADAGVAARASGPEPSLPTSGTTFCYGLSAARILAWVEEALSRLQRVTSDIILTDFPLAVVRGLPKRDSGVSLGCCCHLVPVVGASAGGCRARERRPPRSCRPPAASGCSV